MLIWKIFAVISVIITLGFWLALFRGKQPFDLSTKIGLVPNFVSAAGVVIYAFGLPSVSHRFWIVAQGAFLAWAVVELWSDFRHFKPQIGVLIAATLLPALFTFEWLALYRLGGSPLGEIPII